ncbi:MAG: sodium-dependent tyrosine transporter [Wolinella sp.]
MFIQLNERVIINLNKITRIKIDEVEDGIRVRFYEGTQQVAKSKAFDSIDKARVWLDEVMKNKLS